MARVQITRGERGEKNELQREREWKWLPNGRERERERKRDREKKGREWKHNLRMTFEKMVLNF